MFYHKRIASLLTGLLFSLLCIGQVDIPVSVPGGGGNRMSDGPLIIKSTLGQTVIGQVENASNQEYIGFWHQKKALFVSVKWVEPAFDQQAFQLGQNFPNPANTFTTIPFTLPKAARVQLTIVDNQGKIAAIREEGDLLTGAYHAEVDLSQLPPGIYFYQLYANGYLQGSRKLILNR